jgi:hypothetical protein
MDINLFILIFTVLIVINIVLMLIFSQNNDAMGVLKIILIVLVAILLVLIIWKTILYFQRVQRSEPVLIPGTINARGNIRIPGNKIIPSQIGSEYTYSFWIYPSGWDYKYGKPKHVLSRGSDPRKIDENMLFNPGVWFYPETSNLLIRFDTYGNSNNFIKEDNTVLNYIEYQYHSEGEDIYSESDVIPHTSADQCRQVCLNNKECSGFSLNKLTDDCHLKTSGDVLREENKDFESYTRSHSMNPYQNGNHYFNPKYDCDLVEIPLQRWSHVAISLWNRTTDIYLNGKLVRSCILKNVPRIPHGDPLNVCEDGGFDGQLSHLRYFNRALNADEIFKLFQYGPAHFKTLTDTEKNQIKKKK